MFGFANASFCNHSFIYLVSTESCFKNLYLTGVLKNNLSTIIVVPVWAPISSSTRIFPAVALSLCPIISSFVFEIIVISDIEAILASASPLNPIV